jgi:hypothetical protein
MQVGISDSVVSVMQGISNEADLTASKRQLRPRRALEREPDTGHAVLVPYSHEAALAQVIELFIKLFINISVSVSKKQCSCSELASVQACLIGRSLACAQCYAPVPNCWQSASHECCCVRCSVTLQVYVCIS